MLEEFIEYAKEVFGIIVTTIDSENGDTFDKIF